MARSRRQRYALGLATLMVVAGTLVVRAALQKPAVDYTGDGISDFPLVRASGGPGSAVTWWVSNAVTSAYFARNWGVSGDDFVSGDFDGDAIADVAIWRPGPDGVAGFWLLPSSTLVGYFIQFGQSGEDPSVVGDYDGDGKTDVAVYHPGATAGAASYWYYRRSIDGALVVTQWGVNGDFVAPGDYDGDGKNDFAIQRSVGGGNAGFFIKQSTGGPVTLYFGTPTDVVLPGDYDGDGKTDLAVARGSGGNISWWVRRSSTGVVINTNWGASATDFLTQGDYDGDGKTDFAVYRPSASPGLSAFFVAKSTGGTLVRGFGVQGDYPVANFNSH